MILYLHGFRSSPQSNKARLLAQRMRELGRADEYVCPQLPASPRAAMALALGLAQATAQTLPRAQPADQLCIIGSSLGGFYATALAERLGCRAVLLNPAVWPMPTLEQQVGISVDYHTGAPFEFKPEYIGELAELAVGQITQPQRYFLLAASGDEVLDYRSMLAHYPGAHTHLIDGGDHAISDFAKYLDPVLQFCDRGVPAQ
jgi:predicted esterase YcpF (UPF0227 family)